MNLLSPSLPFWKAIFSTNWQAVTDVSAHVAQVMAAIAAGYWFISNKIKQRIQFDVDCAFLPFSGNPSALAAELRFVFENKGFVEHRLYNLIVSVHACKSEERLEEREGTKELEFKKELLVKVSLIPKKYLYYFVRPGVRQIITHIVSVPTSLSIIRVTSSFAYDRKGRYPHTVRRAFQVPARADIPFTPGGAQP